MRVCSVLRIVVDAREGADGRIEHVWMCVSVVVFVLFFVYGCAKSKLAPELGTTLRSHSQ